MRTIIALVLLAASLGSPVFAADKPVGPEELHSVDELAMEITSYFPKVQGTVTTVQTDRLTIALGKKEGLMPGMSLTLWRDGKEILHPVSGIVLGREEEEIGTVEVTVVGDGSSTAVIRKKLKDPKLGDRARITPKKIALAVVPLTPDRPELVKQLTDQLAASGRFTVLESGKTSAFVKERKLMDSAMIKSMGSAMNVDAVVVLGLYPTEGKLMTITRLFYTEEGRQLDTIVALLEEKSGKEALGEIKPFFAPVPVEAQKSGSAAPELPFLARSVVYGDFEGNGKPVFAFSDGTKLHLYRNEPSGWREVWTETPVKRDAVELEWNGMSWQADPNAVLEQINIDSADINGNGSPEIFVTAMYGGKVFSYVIEYREGGYRQIAALPGFLRVLNYPGKGAVLIGQAYDPVTFFAGQPKVYSVVDGKYVAGAEITLPKELGLYGWTYANLGDRQPLLVALDDDDHLMVYSGLTMVWKSAEEYTSVGLFVYKPVTGIDAVLSGNRSALDKAQRVKVRGRVVAGDLNNDGRDEIVIQKNIGSSVMNAFTGAELYGLAWTGARLESVWSVRDIIGPVYDIAIMPQGAAAPRIAALVKAKGGLFTKDSMQVMSYSMK
jgi:hypothetical protein